MTSTKIFKEGTLQTKRGYDQIIPSDKTLLDKFDSLINGVFKGLLIPKLNDLIERDIHEVDHDTLKEVFDEKKFYLSMEFSRRFITEFNTVRSNGFNLVSSRKPMRDPSDVIITANFTEDMGRPKITVDIDYIPLLYLVIVDDQTALDKVKKTYLSYSIHEWEHRLQYSKHGREIFILGKKKTDGMHEYIQTPLELPAWGITIGDTILRYTSNKNEALDVLRNGDTSFVSNIPKQTIVDAINLVFNTNTKNSKKLRKYAYTYILTK